MIEQNKELFIVIGLPKCGTTSLNEYFNGNGKKSLHYFNDKEEKEFIGLLILKAVNEGQALFTNINDCDALTQIDYSGEYPFFPQINVLGKMFRQYPNAKFILNVRNDENWVKSISKWGEIRKFYTNNTSLGIKGDTDEDLKNWFNQHIERVKKFFEDKKDKLLVFDIEKDSVEKLNTFTNLHDVKQFPIKNVSKKPPMLISVEDALDLYLKDKGFTDFEGNSGQCPSEVEFLGVICKKKKLIIEIGFNKGNSAITFLKNSPDCTVVSFDIGTHKYVKHAKEFIDSLYPKRHILMIGDSKELVSIFHQNNPTLVADLIFIDGDHSVEGAMVDLKNCKMLANNETIVVLDDTIRKNHVFLEYWNIGPTKAWIEQLESNTIEEIGHFDLSVGHGVSWGKYI